MTAPSPVPFAIAVPDAVLDDLRQRLDRLARESVPLVEETRRLIGEARQLTDRDRHQHDGGQDEQGQQGEHDDGDGNPTRDISAEETNRE